ncbi:MAG: hypothetical protein ACPF9K_07745 [Neptuniibacter sp.]
MMVWLKVILLSISLVGAATAKAESYTFISGKDLLDALSQDSMMLKGYFLGVVDVLKDAEGENCFIVPLASDADQQMFDTYMAYWKNSVIPAHAVEAISEAMSQSYPCE